MTAQLIIPRQEGKDFLPLFGRNLWTIGRTQENTIVLRDPHVSRKHALIKLLTNEDLHCFYIVDAGSRNGTWVNRQAIAHPTRLHNGDAITIGGVTMEFIDLPEITLLDS